MDCVHKKISWPYGHCIDLVVQKRCTEAHKDKQSIHTHTDTEMRSTNKHFLSGCSQKLPSMPLWLSFLLPLCGRVHPCLRSSTQRPQRPREHCFLWSKYTTKPRIPRGPAVIKHMCSLAACPSLFSLTFAYITLFRSLSCSIPLLRALVCQMKRLPPSPTPSGI